MRRHIKVTSLILLITVILVGCSGGKKDKADIKKDEGDLKNEEGGIIRYWLQQDPPNLDPAHGRDTTSAVVQMHIYDGLVDLEPLTLEPQPAVAESWTISEDGLVYTFHLRKGVKFHNGREVTAEDFRYSFERILDPKTKSERTWVLEQLKGAEAMLKGEADTVEGIKVIDDYTIELTLKEPLAFFISLLSMESASVIPKEEVMKWGEDFSLHPVGCGPFVFSEWFRDSKLIIKKFDEYYGEGPYIDEVRFLVMKERSMAFENYKKGNLDILTSVPSGRIMDAKRQFPDEMYIWKSLGTNYLSFNHEKPPFKGNRKLRLAFNYAIDREGMCEIIHEGVHYPAAGILPKGLQGYNPDLKGYEYNPEKAKELLAEAGYPGGEGLGTLELWYNTDEQHRRDCLLIQDNLRDIGVDVTLNNMDWGTFLDSTKNGEKAFFRSGWIADLPDPDNFLYVLLHSSNIGEGNYSRYNNPEYDALVEKARKITNMEERIPIYQEAERMAVENATWLFLWHYGDYMLVKTHVKGVVLPIQGDWKVPLEKVHIER